MNSTRNTILNHIRQALQRNQLDSNTIANLEARLAAHTIHEQPTVAADLTTIFIKQLTKVAGTIEIIPRTTDIPFAVLAFLQQYQLPQEIVAAARLKAINWPRQWQVAYRAAQPADQVSVSWAFAGIAETGSVVLLSSPNSPTTLNFLPSNHIVILSQADLVAHIEAVWIRLRSQPFPRTLNIITGPSRTADIEQTLQVGAHGPKRLHVILNTQK